MTSFPNSPRVVKGALVAFASGVPLPRAVVFQYNPHKMTRTITPRSSEEEGARSEVMRLAGAPKETIQVEVDIDATDQLERGDSGAGSVGIYPQLSVLETLVYPESALVVANRVRLAAGATQVIPPTVPLTLFIWGAKRILPVRVETLTITEEAFDPALNPIRATVVLGLGVLSYEDLSSDDPGFYVFLAHHVVKEALGLAGTASSLGAIAGGLGRAVVDTAGSLGNAGGIAGSVINPL